MTDTTDLTASTGGGSASRSLTGMKLDELKRVATGLGITGTSKMRKSDLVAAIGARGSSGAPAPAAAPATSAPSAAPVGIEPAQAAQSGPRRGARRAASAPVTPAPGTSAPGTSAPESRASQPAPAAEPDQGRRPVEEPARAAADRQAPATGRVQAPTLRVETPRSEAPRSEAPRADAGRSEQDGPDQGAGQVRRDRDRDRGRDGRRDGQDTQDGQQRQARDHGQRDGGQRDGGQARDNGQQREAGRGRNGGRDGRDSRDPRDNGPRDDDGQGRGRRRQRGRDRKRGRGRGEDFGEVDTQVREDDVLVPVAGILDVLDSYAFVRTSGYTPGTNDVYVPMGMVKKHGMRKGDAVTGAVRAMREGEQLPSRQKFNALVQVDTVSGMSPDEARERVEFSKLTPLYPQERLRLESDPKNITNRVIDLVAPIGKGQRGLIVAPAKSGKTLVMQAIANAITTNNPECHLMVVLVDERPEEVTDFQRSVKGEVIASTFDRPASDHTEVAELAIERAKRLVEMGHDVVVLLDGITRLGRAYNLAAPASGRIMSGGVDSAALYPPKKFFGAARNIENGGSLTILATALIDSGSKMDEVIFEEFKGTGNWELRLSRQLAERRIFPAIDVNGSGTRREEILLGSDELKIMWKLRRVLAALDNQQGIELLLDRLRKTPSNIEFLMQVQQTSSIKLDDEDD